MKNYIVYNKNKYFLGNFNYSKGKIFELKLTKKIIFFINFSFSGVP